MVSYLYAHISLVFRFSFVPEDNITNEFYSNYRFPSDRTSE